MKIVTLSGWGQPHDALSSLCLDSTAIHYAACQSVGDALDLIAAEAKHASAVIGWSLGGQLAVRAIAEKKINPAKLVLIATPYQFVESPVSRLGMKRPTFDLFSQNFSRDPLRTISKAWELVGYQDQFSEMIRSQLSDVSKQAVLANDWLNWLLLLDGYSCDELNFDCFPPTLLVHGEADVVVESAQSQRFAERIPNARLSLWADCGHAPHWHDTNRLKQLISEHLHA
jgi:pimeloyl-[acyl-carrier protein] methyl ester esterase